MAINVSVHGWDAVISLSSMLDKISLISSWDLLNPPIAFSEPLLESVLSGETIPELLPKFPNELLALSEIISFKEMSSKLFELFNISSKNF